MNRQRLAKMLISATVAAALFALTALQSGMAGKAVFLGSLVIALKDIQSYLSTSPMPQESSPAAQAAESGEKTDG